MYIRYYINDFFLCRCSSDIMRSFMIQCHPARVSLALQPVCAAVPLMRANTARVIHTSSPQDKDSSSQKSSKDNSRYTNKPIVFHIPNPFKLVYFSLKYWNYYCLFKACMMYVYLSLLCTLDCIFNIWFYQIFPFYNYGIKHKHFYRWLHNWLSMQEFKHKWDPSFDTQDFKTGVAQVRWR